MNQNHLLTLLDGLSAKGVIVRIDGDKLFATPRANLNAEELASIKRHKQELIEMLTVPAVSAETDATDGNWRELFNPFSTNGDEPDTRSPLTGEVAGAIIRLGVISAQLQVLGNSIETIRRQVTPVCSADARHKTTYACGQWWCEEHIEAIEFGSGAAVENYAEELDAFSQALGLSRELVEDLRKELADAAEQQMKNDGAGR